MSIRFHPLPTSLQATPYAASITKILQAAIAAVEPEAAVKKLVRRSGRWLRVAGQAIDLQATGRIFLVGAGKASVAMARGLAPAVQAELAAGAIVTKTMPQDAGTGHPAIQVSIGAHPVPDERSLSGTRKITGLLQDLDERDLVFCLISGGGSALLACPAPGVSLEDLQELTKSLLSCGASIQEINTLRKHLDLVKGGGLLRMASPARVVTLVLSDVVGSSLETIASGPTVPDPSTFADAVRILKSYRLWETAPAGIIAHLEAGLDGKIAETLKPGDPLLDRSENILVGSNQVAALAALEQARQEGFNSLLLTTYLQGEASQAGKFLAAVARQVAASGAPAPRPACILAGGETTVTLRGSGLGGRNQEVALGAVESLAGVPGTLLVTLATDGEDATSGAAGAVVTGETLERARQAGLDPADSLRRNDSFHFFERLGDVLVTGPTGTNVNDLNFIFLFPEEPG